MNNYEKAAIREARRLVEVLDDIHADGFMSGDKSFVELAAAELLAAADDSLLSKGLRQALIKELIK
ncbi:hypothetical protein [Aliiglaciecola lipolytica]|nr:hypothetical protein [Aliiglaciecola lipolytica]